MSDQQETITLQSIDESTEENQTSKKREPITDYDGAWKAIIEALFTDFIKFFLPDVYDDIDWSRGYEFLDQELRKIKQDAKVNKRFTDRLVKVWRKDGTEKWVLIHIEVQSQQEKGFEHRMYIYHYRLSDLYARPVASFVVLGDTVESWKPAKYEEDLWGTELTFKYPVVKLSDYRSQWSELEASQNPFAMVVMTHLQTQDSHNDPEARYKLKLQLIRRLYKIGLNRDDIINLFKFIDWLMWLPKDLELDFWQEIKVMEEGEDMVYKTTGERIEFARGVEEGRVEGLEEGLEKGREEGELLRSREILLLLLDHRFTPDEALKTTLEQRIALITNQLELDELIKYALTVPELGWLMDYLPVLDEQDVTLTEPTHYPDYDNPENELEQTSIPADATNREIVAK